MNVSPISIANPFQAPPRDMFSTAPVGPAVACFAKARMSSHFFFLVRLYRVHQEKRKIELRSDFTNKHDMVTICAMNVYMQIFKASQKLLPICHSNDLCLLAASSMTKKYQWCTSYSNLNIFFNQ